MNNIPIAILLIGCLTRTYTAMSVDLVVLEATTVPESLDNDPPSTEPQEPLDDDPPPTIPPNCTLQQLQPGDVIQLKGRVIIKAHNNLTFPNSQPYAFEPLLNLCFTRSENLNKAIYATCDKFQYDKNEFTVLLDGTVMSYGEVLEPGSFAIQGDKLLKCYNDYDEDGNLPGHVTRHKLSEQEWWSILIGQIGSFISIVALTAHLVSFCLVPAMRNLPGYNLASLSLSFLLGYLFQLIGQIPDVLGFFCVLCGIFVQMFFLSAFFFMNTLAFDVWRTLKMATTKLVVSSHGAKRRQFIYYSAYAWGIPFIVTATSVIIDYIPNAPASLKPGFGKNDICLINNVDAKKAFFAAPAFALFVANAIFFVMSAIIIRTNAMKCDSEEQRRTERNNFVLYLRLGIMMGVTWLFEVIAIFLKNYSVWMICDVMNSLQGLFIFLLFTCSKKVFNRLRERLSLAIVLKTRKTSTSDLFGRTIVSHKP